MGKYDSSKYRVVPLVDAIKISKENFDKFVEAAKLPHLSYPSAADAFWYGDNEKQLKPPKEHLRKLIEHLAAKEHKKGADYGKKRNILFGLDPSGDREEMKKEALRLLEENYKKEPLPKAWYIFEGCTNPDIFIEGDDYVIICEGKWTEPHITKHTTYLRGDDVRYQMVRHIQGALNYTDKKVYAFYIVDEDCGYTSDLARDAFEEQLESESIQPENKKPILDAFHGYTTWQNIKTFIPSIHFYSKEEIDALL